MEEVITTIEKYAYAEDLDLNTETDKERAKLLNFKRKLITNNILYMLNRLSTMFKYEGLPETIRTDKLDLNQFIDGISYTTDKYNGTDIFEYKCTLGGKPNVHYEPSQVIIANPGQNFSGTFDVEEDGVLFRNDSLKVGLMPLLYQYSYLLAENMISLKMGLINTRAMSIISSADDDTTRSIELFIDDLEAGKLSAVFDSQLFSTASSLKAQPLYQGSNNSLTSLIETNQYIRSLMFNELGLNQNFNMKREALNSAEVSMNDEVLIPLIHDMLHCREDAIKKFNEKYGTNASVKLCGAWAHLLENNDQQVETENEDTQAEDLQEMTETVEEEVTQNED